jgi:general secretion pathway protein E
VKLHALRGQEFCGVTAPDAVSALENLLRWNADAAGQVLGVIAQKLLRKVCPDCQGVGCDACQGIGYRGRTAAFEVLSNSTEMLKLLHARAPRSEILACALRNGMMTLAQAAAQKVEEGVTTEAEARRVVGTS